jgi:ubiquinone/menaquinone biosynthesis C-methylase UbiE
MKKALTYLDMSKKYVILDVGGRGLEGDRSYRSVFENNIISYHIADIQEGENVTHVMPAAYVIPSDDNYYDIIVSGQTLEHVKNPFRLVAEMKRVLKPNGFLILIAPSTGHRHDIIDCWRFMDDSFKAIAEETELKVVANWIDNTTDDKKSMPWKDHVFVGQKIK